MCQKYHHKKKNVTQAIVYLIINAYPEDSFPKKLSRWTHLASGEVSSLDNKVHHRCCLGNFQ